MITIKGQGVSGGIAFGRLQFHHRTKEQVEKRTISDVHAEIKRLEAARGEAVSQLDKLHIETTEKLGEEKSLLFEIHQMLLEDEDYTQSIIDKISNDCVCAEYAVDETGKEFAAMFSDIDDDYMKARSADIKDVSQRLIVILTGVSADEQNCITEDTHILASEDLMPSETAQLDKEKVLAIVTVNGSANSHTAIFALTMGIPAVIGLGTQLAAELEGKQVAVDGTAGCVYIEPDTEIFKELQKKKSCDDMQKQLFMRFKGQETKTRDGIKVNLYANIGNVKDIDAVLQNDAEGIGLFRSEFLFLEKNTFPTEEEQFLSYKEVAEKMKGKRVVIRTIDIGADKQLSYFNQPHEENPAMGMRAIRICLTQPEIFKVQLRALYRASAYGKIAIMFPMITSVPEIRKIREICNEVKNELEQENIAYSKEIELGIMIETPASAIISDELAKEVDFFSVGTNDLTQYTLAIDRQNPYAAQFCDTHHKAVLRLIEMAAANAHEAGIWIGICGELAADETLTKTFLEYGIDELSVSPSRILGLRAGISDIYL